MAMSVLQIRLEEDLKNEVSALFDRLGMDIPTAVRIFFKRAVAERGLPFEVKEKKLSDDEIESDRLLVALRKAGEMAEKNGAADMTEEEIEAEIKAARAERRARKARLLEDA